MKEKEGFRYQKCYVALTLPGGFHQDFRDLLEEIRTIDPELRTVDPKRPHITILRMGSLNDQDKPLAERIIGMGTARLWGNELHIGGMGTFKDEISLQPDILYLKVKCSKVLSDAHNILKQNLAPFINHAEYFPFIPHVTIAHILGKKHCQETFKSAQEDLKKLLAAVSWDWKIEELALYGRDTTKIPCYSSPINIFRAEAKCHPDQEVDLLRVEKDYMHPSAIPQTL